MKPSNIVALIALLGIGLTIPAVAPADDIFTFAGFTFDQRNTPDQATRLGNGANLGGAVFSAGFATGTSPNPINFPQVGSGFNTNLSLAQLSGLRTGLYAVNLPDGNNGTATRHGLEVWWSNGRAIENLAGTDFVIYESASTSGTVEGLMVRIRTNHLADLWTDWFYFAPTNFQSTTGPEGLHSYPFDASTMGAAPGATIDRIQLANLIQSDRIAGAGTNVNGSLVGEGKVLFDGSTSVLPDAGITYDANRIFDTNQFDPDPLYLASMHFACEVSAPELSIAKSGTNILLTWPSPSCFGLETTTNLAGTNITWISSSPSAFQTNGLNAVTLNSTNAARFFRLAKP